MKPLFQDDGNGLYLLPSTTPQELAAWEAENHKHWTGTELVDAPLSLDDMIRDINAACVNHIKYTLGWTIEKQASCIDGFYVGYLPYMAEAKRLTIVESNRCSDLAELGQSYTPAWPTTAQGALSYTEVKELLP